MRTKAKARLRRVLVAVPIAGLATAAVFSRQTLLVHLSTKLRHVKSPLRGLNDNKVEWKSFVFVVVLV